ncbi:CCC motif membrane protein [Siansivirga zeaxanthinifaciens]|uniref:Membrane protein n=1 Tax=Siansivirga zeaxanthinifaciens CC-SAMT-1 TaxID=1454006 RepID=A0A0C5WM84_9FLAO|nr:CCC motif membrane protein [Siansivirga zeaxanthinifaciens]AJR03970.1 membrane protein [Siansivirga zeaxanthinifaciens CC-SAMT-1]
MEKQNLPNSTLTLVMGILSIVGCCCYGAPGLIFAIIAIILGTKATNIYKEAPENYDGYGNVKAGKIMGYIGLILSILFVVFIIWIITYFGWETLQNEDLMREKLMELQQQQ